MYRTPAACWKHVKQQASHVLTRPSGSEGSGLHSVAAGLSSGCAIPQVEQLQMMMQSYGPPETHSLALLAL